MNEEHPSFAKVEDECRYWKEKASEYHRNWIAAKEELEDFQISSRELESELDAQLEQLELQTKDLQTSLVKLEQENEILRGRLDAQQNESYVTINTLQEEQAELSQIKEELARYTRDLEQKNDDLERQMRVTLTTLEDFEARMNQQIERNVILESELDDKENMAVMCQRLKDEVRDLRQEINRHQRKKDDLNESQLATTPLASPQQGGGVQSKSQISVMGSSTSTLNGRPPILTPSTRINALNMVGDLLKKVGALESRLASCRSHIITKEAHKAIESSTPQRSRRVVTGSRLNGEIQKQTSGNVATITV